MQNLLYVLPLLACPIAMGLMMWFMGRGMRGDNQHQTRDVATVDGSMRAEPYTGALDDTRPSELADIHARLAEVEARNRALREELEVWSRPDIQTAQREAEPIR